MIGSSGVGRRWSKPGGPVRPRARFATLLRVGVVGVLGALSLAGCLADPPPQNVVAVAGDGQATLSWEPPVGQSAATVTAYKITPRIGAVDQVPVVFASSATTQIVTGLSTGVTYTFAVAAIQPGGADSARSQSSNPVTPTGPAVVDLTAGSSFTCAVLEDGTARCWGGNQYGMLGNGTVNPSSVPVPVTGLAGTAAISGGGEGTSALHDDGTVSWWGSDDGYPLTPVSLSGLSASVAIDAGTEHACALIDDGTARCWGAYADGERGGPVPPASHLSTVTGLSDAVGISAGGRHSCALLEDGTARCWGRNDYSQLGNPSIGLRSFTPAEVVGLTNGVAISNGITHTCAVLGDGTVSCWGSNSSGELGRGSPGGLGQQSNVPTPVVGITTATGISAGNGHACAVLDDGTVQCWGNNQYGQLGNGSQGTGQSSSVPVPVVGVTDAVAIEAGGFHTCALLQDATVRCWGFNQYGQLGNGRTTASSIPVVVHGLS